MRQASRIWIMATISPVLSEAGPSLEETLSRYGLKTKDLDKKCPQSVRDEIAVKLDDWEMVGRCLEFSLEKLRDINRENASQELCRIALLDTWGKREGHRATYLKLAGVLHRRNAVISWSFCVPSWSQPWALYMYHCQEVSPAGKYPLKMISNITLNSIRMDSVLQVWNTGI